MARPTKKTTTNVLTMPAFSAATPSTVTGADIAARAFAIYCERGRQDGHDVEDWLQAERELQKVQKSTAA